jgi:hypothetical protein
MDIKVCDNGFIKVDSYYVQGMQRVAKPHVYKGNDSNPSCTCPNGFTEPGSKYWCEHKHTAYKHLVELRKKV